MLMFTLIQSSLCSIISIVAELRRLLIETSRLLSISTDDYALPLQRGEIHYLKRVLRLRDSDLIEVVDGVGNLWEAKIKYPDFLELTSTFKKPLISQLPLKPKIGIAFVKPRRGTEEIIRMSCELGVDLLQPLYSKRSTPQSFNRAKRWKNILAESLEQSERLWMPSLLDITEASNWWNSLPPKSAVAIASPRLHDSLSIETWTNGVDPSIGEIWITIGPEGGWTPEELLSANSSNLTVVSLGKNILRTSTAAIAACHSMVSWRDFII